MNTQELNKRYKMFKMTIEYCEMQELNGKIEKRARRQTRTFYDIINKIEEIKVNKIEDQKVRNIEKIKYRVFKNLDQYKEHKKAISKYFNVVNIKKPFIQKKPEVDDIFYDHDKGFLKVIKTDDKRFEYRVLSPFKRVSFFEGDEEFYINSYKSDYIHKNTFTKSEKLRNINFIKYDTFLCENGEIF